MPLFNDIEMPSAKVLEEMEETGIAVDAAALKTISKEFGEEAAKLERECYELAGQRVQPELTHPASRRAL